ncbi:MAG: ABC transporter ATP-binding protein [Erysipelothrix sp.]|nr:ABC transporter ATP-binding protein [Erysipelothrix sp.]
MIQIQNVSKSYAKTKKAVDDLSLHVPAGTIMGFIGPNGAGKTTTLKMLAGILKADEGSITLNGFDIEKQPIKAKEQFGYVFDTPDFFLQLKGIEYLRFVGDIYEVPSDVRQQRIVELANTLDMNDALNDKIQSYSHGMRQKIMIMGVLLHQPNIWILDEPLTGLDPQSSFNLKQMMKEHAQSGKTVFFSTHVLEVAEKLCDKIAIINHGKINYTGTLVELKEKYPDQSLEEIFLEVTLNG